MINNDIQKYDINKTVKQLRKVAKENKAICEGTIFLIANELRLYNSLVDQINSGNTAKEYTIYQIGISVYRHLADFHQIPIREKPTEKEEPTILNEIIRKVNQIK